MSRRAPSPNDDARTVLDTLSTAVVVANSTLHICQVNAAAESLLALSAAKLIGRRLDETIVESASLIALVRRALSDKRTFTERDLHLTTLSMHRVLVDCSVSPWMPASDSEINVVIELISVERHQRIQLEENLLMQNEVTSALMRGLAHEVKNPLGGIRGAAQLLERQFEDPAKVEYTQIIIGEADRLRTLVDRMLSPHGLTEKQAVNIHDVLEHVRQLVDAENAGGLEIIRDYDPSLPEISGDRDQLIQSLLNLVRNAARAVAGSDGTITLRTRAQRKFTIGEHCHRLVLRVDIIDTGPGVPEELAERIFYPMVSGHADGTGLGLPLAQAMINRQGGLIGFSSEPGDTEFNVWLPVELGI